MTAAAITGGVVLLAIVVAFTALAFALRDAERRTTDARVNDSTKAGQIALLTAELETQTKRAESAERRADALDSELAQVAEDGDVTGARERVLERWRREAGLDPMPAAGGDSAVVLDHGTSGPAPVEGVDRDGLERPE